jgi:hypothetical protein
MTYEGQFWQFSELVRGLESTASTVSHNSHGNCTCSAVAHHCCDILVWLDSMQPGNENLVELAGLLARAAAVVVKRGHGAKASEAVLKAFNK